MSINYRRMENLEKNEVLSRAVRAGKRTYFFDVKTTKGDDKYLTITESKRKFNADNGTFFYEKHKLFLYKEDFVLVQKPGYRYIVNGHIAGNIHTLRDYMPDDSDEITLRIFGQGQVLL